MRHALAELLHGLARWVDTEPDNPYIRAYQETDRVRAESHKLWVDYRNWLAQTHPDIAAQVNNE